MTSLKVSSFAARPVQSYALLALLLIMLTSLTGFNPAIAIGDQTILTSTVSDGEHKNSTSSDSDPSQAFHANKLPLLAKTTGARHLGERQVCCQDSAIEFHAIRAPPLQHV